jgi:cell fate (sporulation/competence/biofilm development) regulator YlbF (YheA/YmcA/DUF963 family)
MSATEGKKNPNYESSAVNLCNPPEIGQKLMEYQDCQARTRTLEANLEAIPEFQELQACQRNLNDINAQIRSMIDAQGSYQDIENGFYAVKQRRESINYKPELVRQYAPLKVASFVIVESVDTKALDALVKAGQMTPETARQCGEVKESFAYIIR